MDGAVDTSGSAAYHFDWSTGEIVHLDGRRWFVPRYMERVYAALDSCRGEALSADRLAEAIWGRDGIVYADAVRVAVFHLRRRVGPGVVETARMCQRKNGKHQSLGYIVRSLT